MLLASTEFSFELRFELNDRGQVLVHVRSMFGSVGPIAINGFEADTLANVITLFFRVLHRAQKRADRVVEHRPN